MAASAPLGRAFEITRLESGAIVASERVPEVGSVAFGLYFPTGSRHETLANNGISHFIEHLVFKGTSRRSADEINREIDLLGGASNAYTSKETLCFHARVLAEHLPRIASLFGDLAADALPEGVEAEVEREREVILSEISAVEDSPEDLVGDLCDRIFFGDHPLGLPVVGSARAVSRLDLPEIRSHFGRHLVADQLVIAAAGNVDHAELTTLAREQLGSLRVGGAGPAVEAPVLRAGVEALERDLEQVNVCLSVPGLSRSDPRRIAAELLSVALGEGYSSRLFREVRDRRGLAYSIYTSFAAYVDAGSFNIYFGVSPERLTEALDVIREVLVEAARDGVSDDEVEAAKLHLHGATVLGHESTSARMAFLAEQILLGNERPRVEEVLDAVRAVERAQVNELAAELLRGPLAIAAVGPIHTSDLPPLGWTLAP